MGPQAAALLCLLAQNPDWPPRAADLPPEAYGEPERRPDDPDYGPRADGDQCLGQLELYGYTPDCTPLIRDEARGLGAGIAADRAWARTAGRPAVRLTLADDGFDLGHPELAARWALNPGELPFPDVGVPTVRHDVNGDGAFTVHDFTSATGTTPPSLDRVRDTRLLAREDRGDVDGNGLLDPRDLIAIFSNGRDEDGNGYVDDIAGWDFVDDDNDPSAPQGSLRGTQAALHAVATANDGVGSAGVCPRCSAIPLRLSVRGLAGADRGVMAILYAASLRSRVVYVGAALLGASPLLEDAVQLAFDAGALVIASAGTGASALESTAWPDARVLVVGAVGHDRAARGRATTAVAPDPCARAGPWLHVVAPGRCDDGAAARAAGVAGLALSAARGEDPGLVPLERGLGPGELWAVLVGSATDLAAPGWDLGTAWGRLNARAAVDAVIERRIPPHGRIVSPGVGAVLDPSDGAPATVGFTRSPSRHAAVRWSLEIAPGRAPAREAFSEVQAGVFEPGEDAVAQASLPLLDGRPDPTSPYETELTLQVRFQDVDGAAPPTVVRRLVHVHRDLDVLPAFPVDVGAGNVGGARAARLEPGGPEVALLATTDGRVHAIDGRGRPVDGFPASGPGVDWLRLAAHPRLPEALDGRIDPEAGAPILAPLSVAPIGPEGAPLIVGITASADLLAFGPRGAVQAGFPLLLEDGLGRAPGAGVTAPVALTGAGVSGALWASARGVHEVGPDGARRATRFTGAPTGAPAVGADGTLWVASADRLFVFAPGADTASPGWPRDLEAVAEARGLLAAWLPAPVLGRIDGRAYAFAAAWGGPITRWTANGGVRALDAVAWHTALALADLDDDRQVDLLGTIAPESQVRGLAPAEAPQDARVALDGRSGQTTTGFAADGSGAPFEPLVLDVAADPRPEAIFGDDEGRVWAVDPDGRVAPGFPKVTGDPLMGPPAAGDLDGDGRLELIAVTRRGRLWAWRLRSPADTEAAWPGARGGLRSLGDADAPRDAGAAASGDGCRCTRTGGAGGAGLLLPVLWLIRRRRG